MMGGDHKYSISPEEYVFGEFCFDWNASKHSYLYVLFLIYSITQSVSGYHQLVLVSLENLAISK